MINVTFTVPIAPIGKARPRFSRRSGTVYTPKNTVTAEKIIQQVAMQHFTAPLDIPLTVKIVAFFEVPKSWSKVKTLMALKDEIRPTVKPDIDNISKACLDSLNGIAYIDDKQVVELIASKRYADAPFIRITIQDLTQL